MDAQTAQLRRQIDATRAALDAKVTQLERRVSQLPAALLRDYLANGQKTTLTVLKPSATHPLLAA
jgi:hypothetical protein